MRTWDSCDHGQIIQSHTFRENVLRKQTLGIKVHWNSLVASWKFLFRLYESFPKKSLFSKKTFVSSWGKYGFRVLWCILWGIFRHRDINKILTIMSGYHLSGRPFERATFWADDLLSGRPHGPVPACLSKDLGFQIESVALAGLAKLFRNGLFRVSPMVRQVWMKNQRKN